MFGRLYQLPKAEAQTRAAELLVEFVLEEAKDRVVKSYSGGMRRRLRQVTIHPSVNAWPMPPRGFGSWRGWLVMRSSQVRR
jgi:hypothetical protein